MAPAPRGAPTDGACSTAPPDPGTSPTTPPCPASLPPPHPVPRPAARCPPSALLRPWHRSLRAPGSAALRPAVRASGLPAPTAATHSPTAPAAAGPPGRRPYPSARTPRPPAALRPRTPPPAPAPSPAPHRMATRPPTRCTVSSTVATSTTWPRKSASSAGSACLLLPFCASPTRGPSRVRLQPLPPRPAHAHLHTRPAPVTVRPGTLPLASRGGVAGSCTTAATGCCRCPCRLHGWVHRPALSPDRDSFAARYRFVRCLGDPGGARHSRLLSRRPPGLDCPPTASASTLLRPPRSQRRSQG